MVTRHTNTNLSITPTTRMMHPFASSRFITEILPSSVLVILNEDMSKTSYLREASNVASVFKN